MPLARAVSQNPDAENLRSITMLPPHSIAAVTLVYLALLWNSGNVVNRRSSEV